MHTPSSRQGNRTKTPHWDCFKVGSCLSQHCWLKFACEPWLHHSYWLISKNNGDEDQHPVTARNFWIILGDSFTTKGLQIMPGVIDLDFLGKIKIMVHSLSKTIQIIEASEYLNYYCCHITIYLNPPLRKKRGKGIWINWHYCLDSKN